MCGIAGYVIRRESALSVPKESLIDMGCELRHRGPDDEGIFWTPQAGLSSQRLSIIDLSPAGRMPLFNETGSVVVVQNGEIYNFAELRAELLESGHQFSSNSDTEVIVHLYEELGERCLERLDGMYAIAIWDRREKKLLLARDRFGEKPLYYYLDSGGLAFASEIKSLIRFPFFKREVDFAAWDQFLTLGHILAPATPFRNTFKLLPGHYLLYSQATGNVNIEKYWSPPVTWGETRHLKEAEYVETFKALLFDSVQSRLVSDVPVGAFLSGGIDSSLVVAAMARLKTGPVRTFSIGIGSPENNENSQAVDVARTLGVHHSTLWASKESVRELIPKLPWLLDDPLGDPALLAVFLVTRFAKAEGFTVMLSGDGGDELFLGYPIYRWAESLDRFYRLPVLARAAVATGISLASRASQWSHLEKASRVMKEPSLVEAVYDLTGYGAWSVGEVSQLRVCSPQMIGRDPFITAFSGARSDVRPAYREAIALLTTYLPDNNLARMDRAAMANGVETRAPFLNPRLLEFALTLPFEMQIQGTTHKYLLRRALAELVGADVALRPKHGFNALPMAAWLRGDLNFLIDQYLAPSRLKKQSIFRPEVVTSVVAQHNAGGRFNHWWKLWLLIVMQLWLDKWGGV